MTPTPREDRDAAVRAYLDAAAHAYNCYRALNAALDDCADSAVVHDLDAALSIANARAQHLCDKYVAAERTAHNAATT